MEQVASASNCVIYGKYPCVDCDEEEAVKHPVGMESFIIHLPYAVSPVVIPAQVAVKWHNDVIQSLEDQTMAKGDFLLVSAPKAGTHLAWEIMSMLANGKATYSTEPKHLTWCEFLPFPEILRQGEMRPRIINTHRSLSQLPPNFRLNSTKTVACMRNPKDVLVSFYYHMRNGVPKVNGEFIKFDDMFDFLLRSKYVPFGRTLDHYADIWDNYRDDPNTLIIFFEDIKENPTQTIRLIAEHMEISASEDLIARIAMAIDISVMREGKYCTERQFRHRYGENATLYRKGEIGDWRNHFSCQQNIEFDNIFNLWNSDRRIPFRFEPSLPSPHSYVHKLLEHSLGWRERITSRDSKIH